MINKKYFKKIAAAGGAAKRASPLFQVKSCDQKSIKI